MVVSAERRDALRRGVRLEQGRRLRHRGAREANTLQPDAASANYIDGDAAAARAASCSTRRSNRLYVLTRFDNAVSVVDLATKRRDRRTSRSTIRSPRTVVEGRPFLYDARHTSSNGEASCSSCHIFGDIDEPRLGSRQSGRRRDHQSELRDATSGWRHRGVRPHINGTG